MSTSDDDRYGDGLRKVSYFVLTMLSNSRSLKVHRSKSHDTGVIRDSYTEAIELMLIIGFIPHNFPV